MILIKMYELTQCLLHKHRIFQQLEVSPVFNLEGYVCIKLFSCSKIAMLLFNASAQHKGASIIFAIWYINSKESLKAFPL